VWIGKTRKTTLQEEANADLINDAKIVVHTTIFADIR